MLTFHTRKFELCGKIMFLFLISAASVQGEHLWSSHGETLFLDPLLSCCVPRLPNLPQQPHFLYLNLSPNYYFALFNNSHVIQNILLLIFRAECNMCRCPGRFSLCCDSAYQGILKAAAVLNYPPPF